VDPKAAHRIVVFSTHIASDVEAAARRILLLDRGRLRFDGTPEVLSRPRPRPGL
jgi:ABC-type multidrug transport system ATPase subunit